MKKKISLATIGFVGLSALLLILALFGVLKLKGVTLDLLFTFLTLTVAGMLTLNSCEMLERKNKLALVSLSLIFLSTLLVVLCFWTKLDNADFFMDSTLVISTLSICFNLITSNILKMGKRYTIVQAVSYICFSIVSLYLILTFLDTISLEDAHLKIFILFIILSFVALCVLTVLSKKHSSESIATKEYVKITKEEYLNLIESKKQLDNLLKEKDKND